MSAELLDATHPEELGVRERGRLETRRRLFEAGAELFAEHGLHGTTTAAIARGAGVAAGTFYLHFKDKQALFREIAFAALADLRQRQRRATESAGSGQRDGLRARMTELVDFAAENRALFLVLFGRASEGAEFGEAVLDQLLPDIEHAFRERRAAGELPDALHPAIAAQALAAMTTRAIAWWIEDPTRATRESLIETLLQMHPVHT